MSAFLRDSSYCSSFKLNSVLQQDAKFSNYSRFKSHSSTIVGNLLLLAIGTFVGVSSVFAQVGGLSIGVSPNAELVCNNLTTQQRVKVIDPTVVQWDCESLGLVVTPGDVVEQSFKGNVADPSYVGGSSKGLTAISKVKCQNRTRGQKMTIQPPASDWNCSSTGMTLRLGDVVKQSIRGTVAASVVVLPETPNLAAAAGDGSTTLTWNATVGADYYRVYNIQNSATAASTMLLLSESTTTMFTHSGLVNGTTYSYVVTAVNAVGESAVSNIAFVVPAALPFDHATAVGQACASCHTKPSTHLSTSNTCDDCHNTTTWIGAIFNHSGITGSCSTCHNSIHAAGKPPAHLVTSNVCENCHITTIWLSVSYMHITSNYPGNHRSAMTCINCHSSTTATVDWRYLSYAPTCAGCHAASYKPGSHNASPLSSPAIQDCAGVGCHRVSDAAW